MPITHLDDVAAFVAIDLQNIVMKLPGVHPIKDIVDRAATLGKAFRAASMPVVWVNVTAVLPGRTDAPRFNFPFPPGWYDLVPELQRDPSDRLVSKKCIGAFTGSDLDAHLRSRGVTQIFLAGVSTSAGVECTARNAYDLGYNVVLISDAMTDLDSENHRHSIEKSFPKIGQVGTVEEVLALFQKRQNP
jgi:nicotinamidase-related amidase